MKEPTHSQHLILALIDADYTHGYKNDSDLDIANFWELARGGFLQSLVTMSGQYNWRFILTDKGREYLTN